jgi:transcriptional regulator with XRE-family HTH domain
MIMHGMEIHGHLADMRGPTVGQLIVRAREAAGLGQAGMGRKLGVSTSTVFRWEHDEVDVPLERLRAIATLCQVPVEQLIPEVELRPLTHQPIAEDPEQLVRLAHTALAAAQSPEDEDLQRKLNEITEERWERLRAARVRAPENKSEDS